MSPVEHVTNLFAAAQLRQLPGQRLRGAFQNNLSWVPRYELFSMLKGHGGCVNTVQWSPDAELLISGSDDMHVNLWRLRRGDEAGADKPVTSLATVHRHNIFDAQMTRGQQTIVSCGADGCVCATEVCAPTGGSRLLFEPDMGHYMASKIAFLDSCSPICLVTFSDGLVRHFDLREPEHRIAIDASGVGLTGIELNPRDGVSLAVGGSDPYLRIYDVRTLSFSREALGTSASGATPVVSLHSAKPMMARRDRGGWGSTWARSADIGISGVTWRSDGRRLLVNYRGGDILMFDMDQSMESCAGDCASEDLPQESARALGNGCVQLNSVQRYEGRDNEQTCAKEVRFLCGGSAVGSGGDCGNLFIWEASSGRLLRKLPADRCVVNCVASHPVLPVVVSSGIDSEIKVWDVGDCRVPLGDGCKRGVPEDTEASSVTSDWSRRRREAAPNATAQEAQERLQDSERRKQRGNELVRQGRWSEALEQYNEALLKLHFQAPNQVLSSEREALFMSLHLNCAFCCLNLEDFALAVESCDKVLSIDERNVKALFRRATALGGLREFERAFEDLAAATRLDPDNSELAKLQTRLLEQQKQLERRERNIYKRLFT